MTCFTRIAPICLQGDTAKRLCRWHTAYHFNVEHVSTATRQLSVRPPYISHSHVIFILKNYVKTIYDSFSHTQLHIDNIQTATMLSTYNINIHTAYLCLKMRICHYLTPFPHITPHKITRTTHITPRTSTTTPSANYSSHIN